MLLKGLAHSSHPRLLLLWLHRHGVPNSLSDLVNVIRIDDQRIEEFSRGSGELAEDEHAAFILPSSHKLLGHQVHAIMERRHKTDVGSTVKRDNIFVTVLLLQEDDGPPVVLLEASIDPFRLDIQLRLKVLVALNERSAGSPQLDEGEPLLKGGILFQEPLNREESLNDPFRVVKAVDSDPKPLDLHAKPSQHRLLERGFREMTSRFHGGF